MEASYLVLHNRSQEFYLSSSYLEHRSPYTILGLGFGVFSSTHTALFSWEIARRSKGPAEVPLGSHAQTCLSVKHPRILLNLLPPVSEY